MVWIVLVSVDPTLGYHFMVRLRRQRSKEQTWGAVFTEKGINNLLQVGWKYHQNDDGNNDDPQLFLQVYDKGKMGYNDDNFILQGGIEQEVIGTTTTLPRH
jgi:hypothetical protein